MLVRCLIINTNGIYTNGIAVLLLSFDLLLDITITFTLHVTFLLAIDRVEHVMLAQEETRRDRDRMRSWSWRFVCSLLISSPKKKSWKWDGTSGIFCRASGFETRNSASCATSVPSSRENVREISLAINRNVSTDTCRY